MKRNSKTLLSLLLALVMALAFTLSACGSSDEEEPTDAGVSDEVSLMEDPEATKPNDPKLASKAEALNEDPSSFYGTWISTSADAENLYGNLEITINENGTVRANITDIDMKGTWKKIDGGIEYKTELISGKIFYGPTCVMTFEEFEADEDGDDDIQVVLKKKD